MPDPDPLDLDDDAGPWEPVYWWYEFLVLAAGVVAVTVAVAGVWRVVR